MKRGKGAVIKCYFTNSETEINRQNILKTIYGQTEFDDITRLIIERSRGLYGKRNNEQRANKEKTPNANTADQSKVEVWGTTHKYGVVKAIIAERSEKIKEKRQNDKRRNK